MSMPIQRQSEQFAAFDDGPRWARDKGNRDLPKGLAALVNTSGPRIQGGMLNTREAGYGRSFSMDDSPYSAGWGPADHHGAGPDGGPRHPADYYDDDYEEDEPDDYDVTLERHDPERFIPEDRVDPREAARRRASYRPFDRAAARRLAGGEAEDKGKEIANRLWDAFFPPEEEEGRIAVQNMETVNKLMSNGWGPEHIKYDEDDQPYALYQHPSGWNVRDFGGMYKEIGHAATPGEAHDVINVSRHIDGQDYHEPFGPQDAHNHIEEQLHGDPEETGGIFHYLAENDPRIKRYRPRQATRTAKDGKCTCWEGYCRVPGTKPCAEGSCRKCDSDRKKTSARRFIAFDWKADPSLDGRQRYRSALENGHALTIHEDQDPGYGWNWALHVPAGTMYDADGVSNPVQVIDLVSGGGRRWNGLPGAYSGEHLPTAEHARQQAEQAYRQLYPIGADTGGHDSGVDYSDLSSYLRHLESMRLAYNWDPDDLRHVPGPLVDMPLYEQDPDNLFGVRPYSGPNCPDCGKPLPWVPGPGCNRRQLRSSHYEPVPWEQTDEGWRNPGSNYRIAPSKDDSGEWTLYGPAATKSVKDGERWANMGTHPDPQVLMDHHDWMQGGPAPGWHGQSRWWHRTFPPNLPREAAQEPAVMAPQVPAGGGFRPAHRVGLPWRDTVIPGTVIGLDGPNVAIRWDDGQYSTEEPHNIQLL